MSAGRYKVIHRGGGYGAGVYDTYTKTVVARGARRRMGQLAEDMNDGKVGKWTEIRTRIPLAKRDALASRLPAGASMPSAVLALIDHALSLPADECRAIATREPSAAIEYMAHRHGIAPIRIGVHQYRVFADGTEEIMTRAQLSSLVADMEAALKEESNAGG